MFLLDEPTQGVDVGAKADLHRELAQCAAGRAAVLISSSDLEEFADLCDRVLIFIESRLSAELTGSELTEGSITRQFIPIAARQPDVPLPLNERGSRRRLCGRCR